MSVLIYKKPKSKNVPNPLRQDPSRTATLRRAFITQMNLRMNQLKRAITQYVVGDKRLVFNAPQDQAQAFQRWLQNVMAKGFDEYDPKNAFWREFITKGWKQGQARMFDDVGNRRVRTQGNIPVGFFQGQRSQILNEAFNNPRSIQKLELLANRVLTDLQGVEQAMATQMSRIIVDALIAGKGPAELGRELNAVVDGLGKNRAAMIARTEIIRAHAEGQLDMIEELGMGEVGVQVEWLTGGNPCPTCAAMKHVVLKLDEAHGLIPVHPNCMCSFMPVPVDAVRPEQKRDRKQVSATLKMLLKAKRKLVKGKGGKRKRPTVNAFNPSQARDEHGRWIGHGSIADAMKVIRKHVKDIRGKPLTLDAANEVAAGLSQLKARGLPMPTKIGFASTLLLGGRKIMGMWHISNPKAILIKSDFTHGPVFKRQFKGAIVKGKVTTTNWFSTSEPGGIFVHEAGHAGHYRRLGKVEFQKAEKLKLKGLDLKMAAKVSDYAKTSVTEFIAETFAGLMSGKKYDKDVMALYKKHKGPKT